MAPRHNWFRRNRSGEVVLELRPDEASFLLRIIGELRSALEQPADSPMMLRLFPRAYLDPTEDDREREYSIIANADLLRTRLDRTQAMLDSLEEIARSNRASKLVLSDDQTSEWMGTLNDARLALGVVIDIDEDVEPDDLADDDPRRFGLEVYSLLSHFFGELVDVAMMAMPIEGID